MSDVVEPGSPSGGLTPIDLGVIFVKRLKIFFGVFLAILVLAVVLAFWGEQEHEYTSMYRLSKAGADSFLESPEVVVSSLKSDWIPQAARALDGRTPNIRVSLSSEGEVVFLRSRAAKMSQSSVNELHAFLLSQLVSEQEAVFEALRSQLKQELSEIRQSLSEIGSNGERSADQLRTQEIEVKRQLAGLKKGTVMAESIRSIRPVGLSWVHIVILGAVLAMMGGVLAVFVSEYVARVRLTIRSV